MQSGRWWIAAIGALGTVALLADAQQYKVVGANDLGMHCVDKEYSVFSILPPFNVVNAQVVKGTAGSLPVLLDPTKVKVTYEPVVDAGGSINSTSLAGKTDFWQYASQLFHVPLARGQGLTGLYMPADAPAPGPQPMAFDASLRLFRAFGIPIMPSDDAHFANPYPLMRVVARDVATNAVLGYTDMVVPVSDETDCRSCHATGQIAASDPNVAWSNDPDLEVQAKRNVLIVHDLHQGTGLLASQPVLCASCHLSPPLELELTHSGASSPGASLLSIQGAGSHARAHPSLVPAPKSMSKVMHSHHGKLKDAAGNLLFPPAGTAQQTCYKCHPGAVTQCLRGAMATGGMECFECHGAMLSVGGDFPLLAGGSIDGQNDGQPRRPWMDVPRCQSCHTGDAVSHLTGTDLVLAPDGIRLQQAWRIGDQSASPIKATNLRFAENPNTQYRASKGHGQLACEACHGSTHAEWPNADPAHNDNVAAIQIQGHSGPLIECNACHVNIGKTTNGPHGLHTVNSQAFVNDHDGYWENNPSSCRACHGTNLLGSVLSRAAATRTFQVEGQPVVIPKGTPVRCNLCHSMPH